ncbi:MAG: 2'-5' RNA ligase family protein [Acidobacteriaceae bacterium]
MSSQPLILTLALEPTAQQHFESLRQRYFPPERNFIPAHITLFHHLPADELPAVSAQLTAATAETPFFPVSVTGLRSLGRGVAFQIESPTLVTLQARLARSFAPWLTRQDRQGFRPHIVVQNKVDAPTARQTLAELSISFAPFTTHATTLLLWRYLGGPWQPVTEFPFTAPNP